ncbi:MAG TPA: hypothetical protein VKV31_00165 [bacterium]|nr:hypothetical protein [bacterium]
MSPNISINPYNLYGWFMPHGNAHVFEYEVYVRSANPRIRGISK